jgi:hypothetical protein
MLYIYYAKQRWHYELIYWFFLLPHMTCVQYLCNLMAWWLSAIPDLSYIALVYIKESRRTSTQ